LNKLEKGLLRDFETAFCSVLALTVLGKKMFKLALSKLIGNV
jgi:hypothetical protein